MNAKVQFVCALLSLAVILSNIAFSKAAITELLRDGSTCPPVKTSVCGLDANVYDNECGLHCSASSEAIRCGDGWTAHKDEQCLKIFTINFLTYKEARQVSKASLVMIKEKELQEFLANYTSDVFEFLWLGGKYDEEKAQFRWDDGEPLTYTNWLEGHPKNHSSLNTCIEFRPQNDKASTTGEDGKWATVVCKKRNLVMCQKDSAWTLQDVIGEIINLRKELQSSKQDLQSTKQELQSTKQELQSTKQELQSTKQDLQITKLDLQSTKQDLQSTKQDLQSTKQDHLSTKQDIKSIKQNLQAVDSRFVPVRSIYIEYYNQSSPLVLWPKLRWQDITSRYAGLFFRASGGGSGYWGDTQSDCSPRITQMQYAWATSSKHPIQISIPTNGWSKYGHGGYYNTSSYDSYEGLKFYTKGCGEVRPKNLSIRIWKRTA